MLPSMWRPSATSSDAACARFAPANRTMPSRPTSTRKTAPSSAVKDMMAVMTVEKKSTAISTGLRPALSENAPMRGETMMDVPTISAR